MPLQVATLFATSATVFALIVGVFSVWNGRMTRREISDHIREIHEATSRLTSETQEATRQLIRETQEATNRLIRETQETTHRLLGGITKILGRIDERVR